LWIPILLAALLVGVGDTFATGTKAIVGTARSDTLVGTQRDDRTAEMPTRLAAIPLWSGDLTGVDAR
jgi:hypothetical protein